MKFSFQLCHHGGTQKLSDFSEFRILDYRCSHSNPDEMKMFRQVEQQHWHSSRSGQKLQNPFYNYPIYLFSYFFQMVFFMGERTLFISLIILPKTQKIELHSVHSI